MKKVALALALAFGLAAVVGCGGGATSAPAAKETKKS